MTIENQKFDIVILGAGSAGSATAFHAASKGLSVALLDKVKLSQAGAKWINDIPPWMFDRALIKRPIPPEKTVDHQPFILLDRFDIVRVKIPLRPMWGVDMRLLVNRLQKSAIEMGVKIYEEIEIKEIKFEDERPVSLTIKVPSFKTKYRTICLSAPLFVDAGGMNAPLRKRVPALNLYCPSVLPEETISAAQEVCDIRDRIGAMSFLEKHNALPGTFIAWTGIAGSFSTRMVYISPEFDHIDLLTGVIHDGHHGNGIDLIEQFKALHPWVGNTRFGGAGLIPMRKTYDRLAAPGIALVGDSGCQVFPAHGSGVGNGLIAARFLVEAVSKHSDIGGLSAIWEYQYNYQSEIGGISSAYEIFAQMCREMKESETETMLKAGFVTESSLIGAFMQKMPYINGADMIKTVLASIQSPFLAARFLKNLPKMFAMVEIYKWYPANHSTFLLKAWSWAVNQLRNGRNQSQQEK